MATTRVVIRKREAKVVIRGPARAATTTYAALTDTNTTNIAQGTIAHYSGSEWEMLVPGTDGLFLKSNGPGASLTYAAAGSALPHVLTDNQSYTPIITDSANDFLSVQTTTGAQRIAYGNAVSNPRHYFLGTGKEIHSANTVEYTADVVFRSTGTFDFGTINGGSTSLTGPDNTTDGLYLRGGDGSKYWSASTNNGTEKVDYGNSTNNANHIFLGSGYLTLPTGVLNDGAAAPGTANQLLSSTSTSTAWVTPSTSSITEGSNLYYTEGRVTANTSVAANTAKVSADGSIDSHSDVDTTTSAPSDGEVLTWVNANSAWEPAPSAGGSSLPHTLVTNTASTSIIEDATSGDEFLAVTTTTGSELISLSNASVNADVTILGSGELTVTGQVIKVGFADSKISIGSGTGTLGTNTLLIGSGTATAGNGSNSVDIGDDVSGSGGTHVNIGALASGSTGTAHVGYFSGGGIYSSSLGYIAIAAATGGLALGQSATTGSGVSRIALGAATLCNANYQLVCGGGSGYQITQLYLGGRGVTSTSADASIEWAVTGGSGTDSTGSSLIIRPGLSTGAGAVPDLLFHTGAVLGTGSTLQTSTLRATINESGLQVEEGISAWGVAPPAQAAHIADPTGGATTDAEARTAIDAILVVLENLGVKATS